MNVLLLSRQAFVLAAIIDLLTSGNPAWRCTTVTTVVQAEHALGEEEFDIVLCDLDAIGTGATAWLGKLRVEHSRTRLTVLASDSSRYPPGPLLALGVQGYLDGAAPLGRILFTVLSSIAAGSVHLVMAETQGQQVALQPAEHPPSAILDRLTPRQREIMLELSHGCSVKEIARHLDLSIGTVKTHLSNIYAALGARNRVEAVMRFEFPASAEP